MLPTDSGYLVRPTKRPRGSQSGPETSPHASDILPATAAGDDRPMAGVAQHMSNTTTPNLASSPSSTTRTRGDDRSRKLSCKECRRLKLKCDRIFPCQSCVKRGCGSLCPEGALTAGRGSRFILANTEQLHDKIAELGERVRQLEEALEQVQAQCSNQPHPLLAPALLRIKTSQELYGTTPLPPPPPTISDAQVPKQSHQQGEERLRESVVALSLNNPSSVKSASTGAESDTASIVARRTTTPPEVPSDILRLSATFPFPWTVDLSIRKRIRDALPPREEAQLICAEARNNALWQYNLDTSETFLPNLLNYCYSTPIEDLSPRRLALFLMILSIGSLVDLNRPAGSLHGEAYHHLARAAVCEIPLMEEPDFDVLHALFFMIYYHLIFSDNKKAVGYAWNLMGFVAKLAQGLGLHRDATRSAKLIPDEHERRRAIFWELLNMDCRMSLSLGRPPSICLAHVDTNLPSYSGVGIYVPKKEIVYHEWKNNFFIQCLTPILEAVANTKAPEYSHVLSLDRSVRDFDVPSLLDERSMQDAVPRYLVMQRALVLMGREIALLQLHRRYFTNAMNSADPFDMNHLYAPSVLATYLSAINLIGAVESLYEQEEQLSTRFLHFWFNVFSAAVMLSLFITRAPTTSLATYALQDLERVCQLFRNAEANLPFSTKVLPQLTKLIEKCQLVLRQNASSSSISPAGNPYPIVLPPSFQQAHPSLGEHAEQMRLTAPIIRGRPMSAASSSSSHSSASAKPYTGMHNTSSSTKALGMLPEALPDIYRFSNMDAASDGWSSPTSAVSVLAGHGHGQGSRGQGTQQTPFAPLSPRIAEDEKFNFDYGALTADLEETSYMAWF